MTAPATPAASAPRAGDPTGARRGLLLLALGLVALGAAAVWNLCQGYAGVGLGDLVDVLRGQADPSVRAVFDGSRFPRAQAGLLVGIALAAAGTLFQTATRNPLSEPSTLGVNAGAWVAVVAASTWGLDISGLPRGGVAFAGGLVAAALVFAISSAAGATPTRLVLTGTAVQLGLTAFASFLLLMDQERAAGYYLWSQGSLSQVNGVKGLQFAPVIALALAAAVALGPRLDLLLLDDDRVRSLGIRPLRARLTTITVGVVLTAAAVAIAGPMSFVGLLAPHLARRFGVVRHRWLLPTAGVWAAALVLAADAFVQGIRTGGLYSELPAGLATALVGAPVLLVMARGISAGGLSGPVAAVRRGMAGGERSDRRFLRRGSAAASTVTLVAAVVGVGAIVLLALSFGETKVAFSDVLAAITGRGHGGPRAIVLLDRLPRVLVSLLAGAALAVSGTVMQAVGRNPLAEPNLLGVTGGAGVGALGLLILFPAAPVSLVPVAAFAGGVLALGVVLAASWRHGLAPERLLLVGVATGAFAAAITSLLVVLSGPRIAVALVWLAGSTYGLRMTDVWALLPWVAVVVPGLWLAGRNLDLLALGEDAPRALGMRLDRTRIALLAAAVLLAAAAVSTVGAIGFVGLIAPHLARTVTGNHHRRLIPLAALVGGSLVALADLAGRLLNQPRGVPTGIIIAAVGAPAFLLLLWRSRGAAA